MLTPFFVLFLQGEYKKKPALSGLIYSLNELILQVILQSDRR